MRHSDFPIFTTHPNLAYLDTAATAQVPYVVLDAVMQFETTMRANVHRSVYLLADAATEAYESARREIAVFIGAAEHEVSFVPSVTYGMHMVAEMIGERLQSGDSVLVTAMEHHSVLLPWRHVVGKRGAMVSTIPMHDDYRLDMDALAIMLRQNVKVVVVTAASNVLGTVNPIADIVRLAHKAGALVVVDAAQYVPHLPLNIPVWGADVVVFSGHKLYGPMGIGVMYIAEHLGRTFTPSVQGGGMVVDVRRGQSVWEDAPWKFEAGTPNVSGVVGLSAAMRYVKNVGYAAITEHEENLTRELIVGLLSLRGIRIIGPDNINERIGVVSFTVPNVHPHDIATLMGSDGVAIRAGHHCVQPLVEEIDRRGVCRASLGGYSTTEDVARCIESLDRARKTLL